MFKGDKTVQYTWDRRVREAVRERGGGSSRQQSDSAGNRDFFEEQHKVMAGLGSGVTFITFMIHSYCWVFLKEREGNHGMG